MYMYVECKQNQRKVYQSRNFQVTKKSKQWILIKLKKFNPIGERKKNNVKDLFPTHTDTLIYILKSRRFYYSQWISDEFERKDGEEEMQKNYKEHICYRINKTEHKNVYHNDSMRNEK